MCKYHQFEIHQQDEIFIRKTPLLPEVALVPTHVDNNIM